MTFLVAPDPDWPNRAAREIARWKSAVKGLKTVHHIGSTSIPGMPAKQVIDLLPVFEDEKAQKAAQNAVEALGYEWLGTYGLEGRAYARLDDADSGVRQVQSHCYAEDHPDIRRHLAFRDALRSNGVLRAGYASVKAACAARHPEGGAAYGTCKSEWIDKTEARALERLS
ncbi:MAG: GrpB family protein [Silicimonas sp.]|nr:GrpB family protein [Silicimonas sp.]